MCRQHCAREWRHGPAEPVVVAVRQQATHRRANQAPVGPEALPIRRAADLLQIKGRLRIPPSLTCKYLGWHCVGPQAPTSLARACVLAVGPNRDPSAAGGGSSFPVGLGPQPGDILNLTTCEFDTEDLILTVESSFGESTSSPAIPVTITSITSGN